VPPQKKHVIIYFIQKGHFEKDAVLFFMHFSKKNWQNYQGKILSNWKTAAWEWILRKK